METKQNLKELIEDENVNIVEIDDPEEVEKLESDELHIHDEKGNHMITISGKEKIKEYLIMRKYQEHCMIKDKFKFKKNMYTDFRKKK